MEYKSIIIIILLIGLVALLSITITSQQKQLHASSCLTAFLAQGDNHTYNVSVLYQYDLCMNLPGTNPYPLPQYQLPVMQ